MKLGVKILSCFTAATMTLSALSFLPGIETQVSAAGNIAINAVNFPDVNFRSYVAENFDTDSDNILSEMEILRVETIDVGGENISDLTGVGYFTQLRFLYCQSNKLTSLNLENNILLVELYCDNNNLGSLDLSKTPYLCALGCENTNLTELDLSGLSYLVALNCSNNQLETLDISENTDLAILSCYSNNLSNLDLSKNPKLDIVICNNNSLTKLDLSKNIAISSLHCSNNAITSLDLSKNTLLEFLTCSNNALTSLDLSKNTVLENLTCNTNSLTNLDLSNNAELRFLICSDNALTSLDISGNSKLSWLYCYYNKLTSLDLSDTVVSEYNFDSSKNRYYIEYSPSINLSTIPGFDATKASDWKGCTYNAQTNTISDFTSYVITYNYDCGKSLSSEFTIELLNSGFEKADGVNINEETFPDAEFRLFIEENTDLNSDMILSETEIAAVKELDVVTDLEEVYIDDLTGIEYFTELKKLYCDNNHIRSLDVSQNTALKYLDCRNNYVMKELDISGCTELTYLSCNSCSLTSLDVSNCKKLTELICYGNNITSLDMSNNTKLELLVCFWNSLTELDVSHNTALVNLSCYNNSLTNLDVSKNTALKYLSCFNNNLAFVDVSKNTALEDLGCYGNVYASTQSPLNLSTIPGFDSSKMSDLQGATYDSQTNTISDFTSDVITYTYDCGKGYSETFTIVVSSEINKLIQEEYSITVTNGKYPFDRSMELFVEELISGEDITQIKLLLPEAENISAYDINVLNSLGSIVPVTDTEIEIRIPIFNGEDTAYYYDGQKLIAVDCEVEDGFIIIRTNHLSIYVISNEKADSTPGNINSDDRVDIRDVVLLYQYISRPGVTIDEAAADVNASGRIEIRDVVLLYQYVSRWDVELH